MNAIRYLSEIHRLETGTLNYGTFVDKNLRDLFSGKMEVPEPPGTAAPAAILQALRSKRAAKLVDKTSS